MPPSPSSAATIKGRDPRKMSVEDLRAAGFEPRTPLQAIRAFYLQKHRGDARRVLDDADTSCLLWPYRLGTNPFARPSLSDERRAELAEIGRGLVHMRRRGAGGSGAPAAPAPAH